MEKSKDRDSISGLTGHWLVKEILILKRTVENTQQAEIQLQVYKLFSGSLVALKIRTNADLLTSQNAEGHSRNT